MVMCFAKFLNLLGNLSHPCCSNHIRLLNTVGIYTVSAIPTSFFLHTLPPATSPHVQVMSIFQDPLKMPSFRKLLYFFRHKVVSFPFDLLLVSLKLASISFLVLFLNTNLLHHSSFNSSLAFSKQNQI